MSIYIKKKEELHMKVEVEVEGDLVEACTTSSPFIAFYIYTYIN
jgi:hypothetical protein